MSNPTYTIPDFGPADLLTAKSEGFRRIRVDVAQTGFFAGREFRTFLELNIPSLGSLMLRFTSAVDFILSEQVLTIDDGSLRLTVETGGAPGGTFANPLPIIGKNRMIGPTNRQAPYYESQVVIDQGGTLTGGTVREIIRVKAASATAQQTTVGASVGTERGLSPGSYFIRITNLSNSASKGVYTIAWEERPVDGGLSALSIITPDTEIGIYG